MGKEKESKNPVISSIPAVEAESHVSEVLEVAVFCK
jgi:hypothetical protein